MKNIFLEKAKKVHGDKYDYSKVCYVNSKVKVEIVCKEHGKFFQMVNKHLLGQGCPKCSGNQKITTEEYIEKAKDVHGNKYDYSIVNYINSSLKIEIICPNHGKFFQNASSHLMGKGCPVCSRNKKSTTVEFIEKAKEVHGNTYDYSLVTYVGKESKIDIICSMHGVFSQVANSHLNGKGCPQCFGNKKSNTEDYIFGAKKVHGDKYDYSLVDYVNSKVEIDIICIEHGRFSQRASHHLAGAGCPRCQSSHGEKGIRNILQKTNLTFVEQYKIKDCKNKRPLPFDFAIFENGKLSHLIEYDGKQHYVPVKWFGGIEGFKKRQINDTIKTKYCIDNNLELIRIKYDEDIEKLLEKLLSRI